LGKTGYTTQLNLKNDMISKTQITGIVVATLGALSLFLEKIYYGYVDDSGALHESLFLPLGFLLLFVGVVLFAIGFIRKLLHRG